MKIRVPATSANLGPGFDSCRIALSAYLTINVLRESEFWEIQHTVGEQIPTN
ncbi:homoserine kinase, partial [Enterococcus faecalis]